MTAGVDEPLSGVALATAAADRLFDDPTVADTYEPRGVLECAAAVKTLGARFAAAGGTMTKIIENARAAAHVLSSDHLQGLSEIVQNADDAGADWVRFHQTPDALFAVHNGRPLTLKDVHALAAPWLTTKQTESAATGRFGIGLLTLHSIAAAFEVHNGDYHLRLGDPTIDALPDGAAVGQFTEGGTTVIVIPLVSGTLTEDEILIWCANWNDESLLFLRTVRDVSFSAVGKTRSLRLDAAESPSVTAAFAGVPHQVRRHRFIAPDGRSWLTYSAVLPSPQGLQRAHKVTDRATPVAVALPMQPCVGGYLSAGLPVTRTTLPLYANAQFDPVASRQGFADSAWNTALAVLVAELWTVAVIDLFATMPTTAWHVIPLPEEQPPGRQRSVQSGLTEQLEALVAERAGAAVARSVAVPVDATPVPITELAVEDPLLEGLLTAMEVAELAGLAHTLPGTCRDADGRWRSVLDSWRTLGVGLPETVSVAAALPLTEDPARDVMNTVALVGAAINASLGSRLSALRCIVLSDDTRIVPPARTHLRLLVAERTGLAMALGIGALLHTHYFDDGPAPTVVRDWLRAQGSLVDGADDQAVLPLVAAAGRAGRRLGTPLSDEQIRALRDALEPLGQRAWDELGPGIGQAITLDAVEYTRDGKRTATTARPAEAYQPRSIDREQDSFAFAADITPGLKWLASRYASVLRSSLGREGLGPQRFLRLLGAETAPRLQPHPRLTSRYSDLRKGLPRLLDGTLPRRAEALESLAATYSLDDCHSPDLQRVLRHIAQDRKGSRRRSRAGAILATLGRAWHSLAEDAEVSAAESYYGWRIVGTVRAAWLWEAGSCAWLDNVACVPSQPLQLRLRTAATLAIHGTAADGYLHPALSKARTEVLAALGVAGEPDTRELITRLEQLRDHATTEDNLAAETAVVYQALAERTKRAGRIQSAVPPAKLRHMFSAGAGLVWTDAGWRPPVEVFRGPPVFGPYRAFAPQVPATEALWQTLQIRTPALEDCLDVLRDMAKDSRIDADAQAITLDVLRLIIRLLEGAPADERQTRRLQRTPLLTSQGWTSRRPVFAVDDPPLVHAVGDRLPLWAPGGEMAQFAALFEPLHLHDVGALNVRVLNTGTAYPDEESTDLFRDTVRLLREDLTRNDPEAYAALSIDWDRLCETEVHVCAGLQVHIDALPDAEPLIVAVQARMAPNAGVLYVAEPEAMARADAGGRAVAGLFNSDRRRLAQAWLAAIEAAREGRAAVTLRLSAERAQEAEAAVQAGIAAKLAAVQSQVQQRYARSAAEPASGTDRGAQRPLAAQPGVSQGTDQASAPRSSRVLVDPQSLVVVDPSGTIVPATRVEPARHSSGPRPLLLPIPEPGNAPRERSAHRFYTDLEKETLGLDLVRRVLGSDAHDMVDLRAQHGVGADAIDDLRQFYELKVHAGPEPDHVTLEDAQIRRALSTDKFFLVIVSGLEGENASPRVRVIVDPLAQLRMSEHSQIKYYGIRQSQSLVYDLMPLKGADDDLGSLSGTAVPHGDR